MMWVGFILFALVGNAVLAVSFAYAAFWVPAAIVAFPIAVAFVVRPAAASPIGTERPPEPAVTARAAGAQQRETPYEVGERVVVDLTQLTSLPNRGDKREATGTVFQVVGPGMYDIFFFPDRPYPELAVASFVPQAALRPIA